MNACIYKCKMSFFNIQYLEDVQWGKRPSKNKKIKTQVKILLMFDLNINKN